jgi:predicted metal-binding membrane protein
MSLVWMAMIAAVVFVEKVLSAGEGFAPFVGAAFATLGIWVAVAPSWVPGLQVP